MKARASAMMRVRWDMSGFEILIAKRGARTALLCLLSLKRERGRLPDVLDLETLHRLGLPFVQQTRPGRRGCAAASISRGSRSPSFINQGLHFLGKIPPLKRVDDLVFADRQAHSRPNTFSPRYVHSDDNFPIRIAL